VYIPGKKFGDVTVMKNLFSLPLGFTYDSYILRQDFEKLPKEIKPISLFKAAVLNSDTPELTPLEAEEMIKSAKSLSWPDLIKLVLEKGSSAMKMTSFNENKITGEITLDKKNVLFFSIPFDDGWKAYDNGNPIQTIKANVGFTGVILDKGKHGIVLNYKPKYLTPGLVVSLLSLVCYMILLGGVIRRQWLARKDGYE
jgi:hypothetical protein